MACDSKPEEDKASGDDKAKAGKKGAGGGGSELAKKASEEVAEIKARLEKGDDIKYACAGNLGQYEQLDKSSDEGDKKVYADMLAVCFVDGPRKLIADLRVKMQSGELGSMDTVDLRAVLKNKRFPADGEAAKVAEDAQKVLDVEIPVHKINVQLEVAKKEKEEKKRVSMGCIKARQVVKKSGEALQGDDQGKAALDAVAAACPEKKK